MLRASSLALGAEIHDDPRYRRRSMAVNDRVERCLAKPKRRSVETHRSQVHWLTVPPSLAVRMPRPSGVKLPLRIPPGWLRKTESASPVLASQTRVVPS